MLWNRGDGDVIFIKWGNTITIWQWIPWDAASMARVFLKLALKRRCRCRKSGNWMKGNPLVKENVEGSFQSVCLQNLLLQKAQYLLLRREPSKPHILTRLDFYQQNPILWVNWRPWKKKPVNGLKSSKRASKSEKSWPKGFPKTSVKVNVGESNAAPAQSPLPRWTLQYPPPFMVTDWC